MATTTHYELEEDLELQEPKKYTVLLLNDNYSTVDFVVEILIQIFKKNSQEAIDITMHIHDKGEGVCGVYTYEIAHTKVAQVQSAARKAGFPLKAILKEEQ